MDSSRDLRHALGIALEALKFPRRNLRLFVPLILLILAPASLLYLAENFIEISNPPTSDNSFARSVKDSIFGYAYYVVYLFLTVAIVSASAMTYKGEAVALPVLFFWMRGNWKGPVITQLYVTILGSGLWVFLDELIGLAKGFWLLICLLSVVAHVFDLYLEAVWTLGLPASVVQDCRGLQALGMASELSRGRRLQGLAIGIVFGLAQWVVTFYYKSVFSKDQWSRAAQLSLGLVLENLDWLVDIFTLVAYTIFYFECKKGQGVDRAVEGDAAYSRFPGTSAHALLA